MLSEKDKCLLSSIQKGDDRAFEMLFKSYYSDLCRFARGYVRSSAVAEDLVSDLFVRIWEQPYILAANISLKGYLHRSIYNRCINYITRVRSNFGILEPETLDKLYDLMPPSSEDSPYIRLMTAELEEEIEKAISRLPAECSKIFLMSRKENLSHKEIAERLSISENTVKVQVYRALSKLREALKEYL